MRKRVKTSSLTTLLSLAAHCVNVLTTKQGEKYILVLWAVGLNAALILVFLKDLV